MPGFEATQAVKAEQAVLGCMMVEWGCVDASLKSLSADDFHQDAHREIFTTAGRMAAERLGIDLTTLSTRLEQDGRLGVVGGSSYLTDLLNAVSTTLYLPHYIRLMKAASFDRKILNCIDELKLAPENTKIEELRALCVAREALGVPALFTMKDNLHDVLDLLQKQKDWQGIYSGFPELDRLLCGFEAGELNTLGARTGVGKTAFLARLAVNLAQRGQRVLVFSTEMSAPQFVHRILPSSSGVDAWKFRKRAIEHEDWPRIIDACARLSNIELGICDDPRPDISTIRSTAASYKADVVFVDYLQRCSLPKADSFRLSVAAFMREFKDLLRANKMVGFLASQLNRRLDQGAEKPTLSDLRESGDIEEASDRVLLLWRPDETTAKTSDETILCEIGKNRHGSIGTVIFNLHRPTVDFREAENGSS